MAELRKFERARLTEIQRVSAEVMQWHLDTIVREEPYLDYRFPSEQLNGVDNLINTLTVVHPMLTEKSPPTISLDRAGGYGGWTGPAEARRPRPRKSPPRGYQHGRESSLLFLEVFVDRATDAGLWRLPGWRGSLRLQPAALYDDEPIRRRSIRSVCNRLPDR